MEVGYELMRVQKFDKSLLLAARTSSGLIGQRAARAARKGEQIWTKATTLIRCDTLHYTHLYITKSVCISK